MRPDRNELGLDGDGLQCIPHYIWSTYEYVWAGTAPHVQQCPTNAGPALARRILHTRAPSSHTSHVRGPSTYVWLHVCID